MLTADLIRPRVRVRNGEITTQSLSLDSRTARQTAADLIQIFQEHVDRPRWELDEALEEYEGVRLDYPIIRGLAKVLRDGATFASSPQVSPVDLRTALFHLAAEGGPVVMRTDAIHPTRRETLLAEVAAQYRLTPDDVESSLYADLLEEQILTDVGAAWTPEGLIVRYNLELARGLLYWASEMRITVRGNYKDLFKFIKLFKLMHTIDPFDAGGQRGGYAITIDGPISPFVRSTLRYGGQMARFLPALMLCPDWTMVADIHGNRLALEAVLEDIALPVGRVERAAQPLQVQRRIRQPPGGRFRRRVRGEVHAHRAQVGTGPRGRDHSRRRHSDDPRLFLYPRQGWAAGAGGVGRLLAPRLLETQSVETARSRPS